MMSRVASVLLVSIALAAAGAGVSATCTEGFAEANLVDGGAERACTPLAQCTPLSPDADVLVTGWWERCCHGEGEESPPPCTSESLEPWDAQLLSADGTPVEGQFVVTSERCGEQNVLRFVGELSPGVYTLATAAGSLRVLIGEPNVETDDATDISVSHTDRCEPFPTDY